MSREWHTKTIAEVIEIMRTSERGLTSNEARRRIGEFGRNKLPEAKVDNALVIFLRQFQSPLIYILLVASLTIFAMGEMVDGWIILAVLFFNAAVGTIQEGKAQNTLLALKKFVETKATVLRDGRELILPDTEIVPGDVVILQEGEKVPADARVTLSNILKIDEAALTGESEPVRKTEGNIKTDGLPTSEQKNMVFKGAHVVAGNGKAIVVATGSETIIGKIAKAVATIDTEIPLKANIRHLSKLIIIIVASASGLLFFAGLALEKSAREMFATIVSLSVSIIPEGLPIVLTLVLASGVWRMSKRNALVKKLHAVEALGQARIIAVDKTGTVTKNEMVVQKVFVAGKLFEISGAGYEPEGKIRLDGNLIEPVNHPELLRIGRAAAFCANARVMFSEEEKQWRIAGDPTEAAMLVLSKKIGFHKDDLEKELPLLYEIPFDYKLKYHATVHGRILAVVGAPEIILSISKLSEQAREELESVFVKLSAEGLRVVAAAESLNPPDVLAPENIESLSFIGFLGMKDGLRPEVKDALAKAESAGIKVIMITGDHKATAKSIAEEAGIYQEGDVILTGREIEAMTDEELKEKLAQTSVFARVTPEHKLRIISAYKLKGEIIAMTGDGVNDAPSLVAADLGVAMGKIGTEVAKEAADIVLLDDNFGSIVSAVEEGRSIYKTIKKVILYLFSTSVGEVLTIAGALFLGYPLPILPAQIIWLNFVTDGFLDMALAMEPKESGLLERGFEKPKKYLVDSLMVQRILLMALPMTIGALFIFKNYFETDIVKAWTICLTVLAVFQWFNAWNCRSEEKSIFQMSPFSNKFLFAATFLVIALQLAVIYNPTLQKLLRTTALEFNELAIVALTAFSIIAVEEVRKFFYRKRLAANQAINQKT